MAERALFARLIVAGILIVPPAGAFGQPAPLLLDRDDRNPVEGSYEKAPERYEQRIAHGHIW